MVQLNNEKQEFTITLHGDAEELVNMQKALIRLMQGFNFNDGGNGEENKETFYFALELLGETLPNLEQQQKGLIPETDYLELPHKITPTQRQTVREAMLMIEHGQKIREQPNPVYEVLKSIEN